MVALCAKTWHLELAEGWHHRHRYTSSWHTTPAYLLGAEPEKEGGGEERGGWVCGSVCGKDFFFSFFPLFLM